MSEYRVLNLEDIVAVVLIRVVGDGWLLGEPVLGDDDVIRGRCLVDGIHGRDTSRPYAYAITLNSYAVELVEVEDARVAS